MAMELASAACELGGVPLPRSLSSLPLAVLAACGEPRALGTATEATSQGAGTDPTASPATDAAAESGAADDGSDAGKLDVHQEDVPGAGPRCFVTDGMDALGTCETKAPPDSFDPELQWGWDGLDDAPNAIVIPLVANLTDDNGDGSIDLCDTPDLVTIAYDQVAIDQSPAHLVVLDGASGRVHFSIPQLVQPTATPALGDIDDDGQVEVIAIGRDGSLLAFEHDGTPKFASPQDWPRTGQNGEGGYHGASIALADLDNDGDVEIVAGARIFDDQGALVIELPYQPWMHSATVAVDLDGDEDMELVFGAAAFHHDGSTYYSNTDLSPGFSFAQIADFDDDPEPEVLVTNKQGLSMLEHDGATKYFDQRPTGDRDTAVLWWTRPATILDYDGDGRADYASSSRSHYSVFAADASVIWSVDVVDASGSAAGTAFDFLGDGSAEAMYADERFMFVFGADGAPIVDIPRTSGTGIEYPVVADVDNDGSAEIVVVSNAGPGVERAPTVQVIRDVDDRWIQARRIWNQHTYHVTNIREDGTVPRVETPHWQALNTFRANAQIEAGQTCRPTPVG